jgi:diadenosine tetraphosphate (Ap4A) HIT family hydrolase
LIKDANYPWLVLIPMRFGVREIYELSEGEQGTLMQEISKVSRVFQAITQADKMNVAALGNAVPQLHVHIIARFVNDAAFPAPVWGRLPAKDYAVGEAEQLIEKVRVVLC